MLFLEDIKIEDYNYDLPREKIALFPSNQRDKSRLLIHKDNRISEDVFAHLSDYLPNNAALIFNNTQVIQARIHLYKSNGVCIEVFCLQPIAPCSLYEQVFLTKGYCEWECLVGNNKRFKEAIVNNYCIGNDKLILKVEKLRQQSPTAFHIAFSWQPATYTFAEVLDCVGEIPLPPYIKRSVIEEDSVRYQTVYAHEKGSVAAPTAGLHFTKEILQDLQKKNIPMEYITLHVGAGTFKPIKDEKISRHVMHKEVLFFQKQSIENIITLLSKHIICVGTTSVRSLESLYWIGVKLYLAKQNKEQINDNCFLIEQWEPYKDLSSCNLAPTIALQAVVDYLNENKMDFFYASTNLMIVPYHYQFKISKGIITNFHQPQSTLLLLIANFVGNRWKDIYDYALTHDFRFLSYGDACLFL